LRLINDTVKRYQVVPATKSLTTVPVQPLSSRAEPLNSKIRPESNAETAETISDKTGVLPRSILGTLSKIQKNLDPNAESEVIADFRLAQTKTFIAVQFLLLLIVTTLGSQVLSKTFLVGPLVDRFRNNQQVDIFINNDLRDSALREPSQYEEKLRFQVLIGQVPQLSSADLEAQIRGKANEIAEEFRYQSADAIKNVFADLISVIVFCIFLVIRRHDVSVLKSFLDELVYGLSDSAKAFIIILFTDIFVGFHSPHGWEVILEGIARHLGLPENRQFIFIFIATFPVVLDTIFKYWIFRFLNRVSPSAVATLRNMNE
jgi:nicotinamide riboside kinase